MPQKGRYMPQRLSLRTILAVSKYVGRNMQMGQTLSTIFAIYSFIYKRQIDIVNRPHNYRYLHIIFEVSLH